eukprot:CAMPEP_0180414338 /NCGR_PEP_ID=MMETSP0989-20121125/45579_1 /TAXON_ID=697907 /ORGANISM="non described non described, Strain CCMP2293" /LENGTH=316 /DNA_ID=CAMNT_0022418981 /DNA_START=83 /DNA_END=1028 /DNA_ORIENTATION=+
MKTLKGILQSKDMRQNDHRDDDMESPSAEPLSKKRVSGGKDGAEMQERPAGGHVPEVDEKEALLGGGGGLAERRKPSNAGIAACDDGRRSTSLPRVMALRSRPVHVHPEAGAGRLVLVCLLSLLHLRARTPAALRASREQAGALLGAVPLPPLHRLHPLPPLSCGHPWPGALQRGRDPPLLPQVAPRHHGGELHVPGDVAMQLVTPDGVTLDAMFWRGASASFSDPVVIRFNGNAEAFELHDETLPCAYTSQGLNFIMFNYRGVGRSKFPKVGDNELMGQLLGLIRMPAKEGTALDAWTVLEYVVKELRVKPEHVV